MHDFRKVGILFCYLAVCYASWEFSQAQATLFYTASDYAAFGQVPGRLASPDYNQIFDNLIVLSNKIIAKSDVGRCVIAKDKLFGYALRNQKCYRIDHKSQRDFEILEYRSIVIYRIYEPQYSSKGYVPTAQYYFSKQLEAPLVKLTIENIKWAFPMAFDLHCFLDKISDPESIAHPNSEHNRFNINDLIAQYSSQKRQFSAQ